MNNPNPITEAGMLAYLRDVTAKYAPQFPEVLNLNAQTSSDNSKVILFCYKDTSYNAAIGYGDTYAEAAVDLRAKLGSAKDNAAKLREQAAKLIAEADKLEGAK
jgi:hypothetical protein